MTKNDLNNEKFYQSSDLALAAAISLFCPIEAIDRRDSGKAKFLFKRDEDLDKLVEAYWRGELKVDPQAYFNQLRTIKARLYGEP